MCLIRALRARHPCEARSTSIRLGLLGLAEGAVAIAPCKVWSWKTNAAVDAVDVVLVQVKAAYVVLGAGEKRAEVDAVAQRWLDNKPLAPRVARLQGAI